MTTRALTVRPVEVVTETPAMRAAGLHMQMREARREHVAALVEAMARVEELAREAATDVYPPGVRSECERLASDIEARADRIAGIMDRVG